MTGTAIPDGAGAPPSAFAKGSPVRRWLPWVLLAVVVAGALSVAVFGSRSAPTAQDRVADIARTIKCPTCSGESVAESNAPASRAISVDIAERIQSGQTDEQIREYYAGRYGEAILLTPSASGINALVWVLPVVALAMAIGFLVIVFRRWGQEASAHASEADKALVAEALLREHEQDVADDDPYGEGSFAVSDADTPGRGSAARKAARAGSSPAKGSGAGKGPAATGSTNAPAAATKAAKGTNATRRQLDPDALAALEEERDFLLRSLDDLEREHDAGDVDDTDYAELKDDYTARAARVLRAIDDRRVLAASAGSSRSWGRTAGILVLVGVLALGVGWAMFRDAGTRAPGQGLSGDARQDSANLVLQAQQATGQATQALNDGDSQGAIDFYRTAIERYDQALEQSPTNVEAMTYRGWVLHTIATGASAEQAAQLDAEALRWLEQAIATDPTYPDARVFRAILFRNMGDYAGAQADLDAVDDSQIPPFMQNMITSVRADVQAGLTGSTTTAAP